MFRSRFFQPRSIAIALLMLTLATLTYAFAASNVIPETGAGDGTGTVSGYTVSNINYTLLSSNPTKLSQVQMDVAATSGAGAPADVRITVDSGSTWVTCTGPTGNTWTCAFGAGAEPSVSAISQLQVVAAQ